MTGSAAGQDSETSQNHFEGRRVHEGRGFGDGGEAGDGGKRRGTCNMSVCHDLDAHQQITLLENGFNVFCIFVRRTSLAAELTQAP